MAHRPEPVVDYPRRRRADPPDWRCRCDSGRTEGDAVRGSRTWSQSGLVLGAQPCHRSAAGPTGTDHGVPVLQLPLRRPPRAHDGDSVRDHVAGCRSGRRPKRDAPYARERRLPQVGRLGPRRYFGAVDRRAALDQLLGLPAVPDHGRCGDLHRRTHDRTQLHLADDGAGGPQVCRACGLEHSLLLSVPGQLRAARDGLHQAP